MFSALSSLSFASSPSLSYFVIAAVAVVVLVFVFNVQDEMVLFSGEIIWVTYRTFSCVCFSII